MAKYRKKPVVIEAMQYRDEGDFNMIRLFVGPTMTLHQLGDQKIGLPTLEGTMAANPGDWIIRGVKGEYYPCKPDIFAATYELVGE